MTTQFVYLNLLPAAIVKAGGASLREPYIIILCDIHEFHLVVYLCLLVCMFLMGYLQM